MQELVLSLRHAAVVGEVRLSPALIKDCWTNATKLSIYAQRYVDREEDEDGIADAAAAVINESARVKMELTRAVLAMVSPRSWRLRYVQRTLAQYERLREAAAHLGKQLDPQWGLVLPCQM